MPENTVRSRIRKGKLLLHKKLESLANNGDEVRTTIGDLEQWARSIHGSLELQAETEHDSPDEQTH
jgi:hypothetical protein